MKIRGAVLVCGLLACGRPLELPEELPESDSALLSGPTWPQWGQNGQHAGSLNLVGQPLKTIYLNYTYDPLVPTETAA